jgi:hypothetical protein
VTDSALDQTPNAPAGAGPGPVEAEPGDISATSSSISQAEAGAPAPSPRFADAPTVHLPRPWPPPAPDTGWWRGEGADDRPASAAEVPAQVPASGEVTQPIATDGDSPETVAPAEIEPVAGPATFERPATPARRRNPAPAVRRVQARRRSAVTRRPAVGLPILVVLAFASAFFGWVSAEPLWLAVGHRLTGTATVTDCAHGRCVGTFTKPDGSFAAGIKLLGVPPEQRRVGATLPAQMTSGRSYTAYSGQGFATRAGGITLAGSTGVAGAGLVMLFVCGLGIAWATGARRLAPRRARFTATGLSVLAPFALFAGLLAAAW